MTEVSVIIPTFNRAALLDALLNELRRQSGGIVFEVIVVDNGSVDTTRDVVRRHRTEDVRIRYVHESDRGAACARNAGIAVATAPLLAFIDDDVLPRRDWIASIVEAFAAHPEVHCIGGRVEPMWPRTPPAWLTPAHWAPLALQLDRSHSRYIDRQNASACLITANFACRAEVLVDVGGFNREYLRDEDREFGLRMWRAGKRGLYVDSVVAIALVQTERLTKRYHRTWYRVTGASHARMYYRDAIDRDGRLDDRLSSRGRLIWGAPGFLYRELLHHTIGWATKLVTQGWNAAFFDECRVRYLVSYLATRWRQELAVRLTQIAARVQPHPMDRDARVASSHAPQSADTSSR